MTEESPQFHKLTMELRRGLLVMAVLESMAKPHYGYSLRRYMAQCGLDIDEGTLYPLLRRLEDQGLLSSSWQVQEGRRRRVYHLSPLGAEARSVMAREWQQLNQALTHITEGAQ